MLRLDDRWIWDFWIAQRGAEHHLFYLQAPRSLGDPEQRHWHPTIGHAVSVDLRDWEVLTDALGPGPAGSWDDGTTWTGSVVAVADGSWAMLYTGACRRERCLVQRIGLATSDDLVTWRKHPANPVVDADPRWYELLDLDVWHDQAWRDPAVVRDDVTGRYHLFVTARRRHGRHDERGVIGHATSDDLVSWEVQGPLTTFSGFGYLEIPQVFRHDGRWHLVVSVDRERMTRRPGPHHMGTFHAVADDLTGPYRETAPLFVDEHGRWYGGKIVAHDGGLWCLAWRRDEPGGGFGGWISDPWPVDVRPDGTLDVELPADDG